jgi:hypothetical protein
VDDPERDERGDVLSRLKQHRFDLGELSAENGGDDAELLTDGGGPGWATMVRMVAATFSAEALWGPNVR